MDEKRLQEQIKVFEWKESGERRRLELKEEENQGKSTHRKGESSKGKA